MIEFVIVAVITDRCRWWMARLCLDWSCCSAQQVGSVCKTLSALLFGTLSWSVDAI